MSLVSNLKSQLKAQIALLESQVAVYKADAIAKGEAISADVQKAIDDAEAKVAELKLTMPGFVGAVKRLWARVKAMFA